MTKSKLESIIEEETKLLTENNPDFWTFFLNDGLAEAHTAIDNFGKAMAEGPKDQEQVDLLLTKIEQVVKRLKNHSDNRLSAQKIRGQAITNSLT